MTIFQVIDTLQVDDNTSVIIEGNGDLLKNGIGVLDENGKPYEVLSVAMVKEGSEPEALQRTMILIEGKFSSKKLFV